MLLSPAISYGQVITLGTARNFVLFTSVGAVTNSGTAYLTKLTGNVGSNSGSSTGFGNVDGGMHDGDVVSGAAQTDLNIAYLQLNTATPTAALAAGLGGGQTLVPGVYAIPTAATLNGDIILNAQGNPNAVFIFQINGGLSTGANAKVKLINGALACNVYWKTEGAVNIGTGNTIRGTIVAHNAAIAFGALDSLEGRALSTGGAITLNSLTAYTPLGCGSPVLTGPVAPTLGVVGSFALFTSIGPVSNGGATSYITGNIGSNLGSVTGYNPLFVNGTIHTPPNATTAAAATALTAAYGQLNALPVDINLLYPAIFGHKLVLTPHTYLLNAATTLTDTLYLNAQGNPNAVFVINVHGALNTIAGAKVMLINGTQSKNVYWKVNGAVSLVSNTVFHGTIIASSGAIDITTGAKLYGRALTTTGAITTNGDSINAPVLASPGSIMGDTTVCVGSSVQFTGVVDTPGVWSATNPRATVSSTGLVTGVSPGIDTIRYSVTNGFGTVTTSRTITVLPLPNAGTISGPSSVCIGSSITLTTTGTGGTWSASNTSATVVNGLVTGIMQGLDTIRYSVTNSCGTAVATKTVMVNPIPDVAPTANQTMCAGAQTTAVVFTGAVAGTTYSWTNSNTFIGLPASGTGNIPSFTAMNSTNIPLTGTITVTPSANGCTGTARSFTITVNPTPNAATIANQAVCNGAQTTAVNFTGTVAGTSYTWTNTNPSIGLPVSGTGNIPAFTATNSTVAPTFGIITVTPSVNGCTGSVKSFNILVNPTPDVTSITNQTICNGAPTTAVNFTSSVIGSTYTWSNSNTFIGLPANGTGNIPSFTGLNSTNIPLTGTINVTPSANGCAGVAKSFTITVNPTPNVATVANQAVCNGALTTAVNFSGTVAGTSYTWSNDNITTGLSTISGTGNIPVFTGTNFTNAPTVSNIVVTPSANGCTGPTKSFSITINPTPNVAQLPNQVLCNGEPSTAVNFTGTVAGTTFAWANNNSSIGLASAGLGNIPSFTALNTTNAPVIAMINIVPAANGCNGNIGTFMITVNPTPRVDSVMNQAVCNGLSTKAVDFTSMVNGTTFRWTNNTPSIGLGTDGIGNIPSFTAINNTDGPITATISVVPTANGCEGPARTFTITVNRTPTAPVIALKSTPAVCQMTYFRNYGAETLPPAGVNYAWSTINAQISDVGNTQQYALVNFKNVGIATVILTATENGTGCINTATTEVGVTTNVADVPAEVVYFNKSFICLQNNEEAYAWGYDDAATLAPTLLTGEINQDYVNATPNLVANRYWVMVTHNGCIQKTYYNKPEEAQMKKAVTEVSVFPNPADQLVNVDVKTTVDGVIKMDVISLLGQRMYTTTDVVKNPSINVSSFPAGVYMVVCYRNNERISITRFIKN